MSARQHGRKVANNEHLDTGRAALGAGRWEEARQSFEASLSEAETPDALEGLGTALWWLCDARASVRAREQAFALFRRAGEETRACAVAIDLIVTYLLNLGNAPAARGWLARAETVGRGLVENRMRGWVLLMRAYLTDDLYEARGLLERTVQLARTEGDVDLELVALADLGVNLVVAGDVEDGMALLDEAMAGSVGGEGRRLETVVYNGCSMLAACHAAGDVRRATEWCRVLDDFTRDYSCPFLFGRCRVHYGSLLLTKGRWEEAEQELRAALGIAKDVGPGLKEEALARFAELRVWQGRLEEAEVLLADCDQTGSAVLAATELRLAQGDTDAAITLLERNLDRNNLDRAGSAPVLGLLVTAYLARGDTAAAEEVASKLLQLGAETGADYVEAVAALAAARLAGANGAPQDSIEGFERAVQGFTKIDLPLEAALARLELARAFMSSRPAAAVAEASNALRGFERIGATSYADRAASLLRSLGENVRRAGASEDLLTRREQDVLSLVALGLSNPQIAERLFISRKTASHHVSSLLSKLAMKTRAELAAYAIKNGGMPVDLTEQGSSGHAS